MDSSPAESSTAANKRKRVSRACDACFAKKDRCDGARPLCRVCKNLDRPCTYNRPERKRGPSQGVRQRLEGQIESLESVLGYLIETYPHMSLEIIKNLRLDDAELAILSSSNYMDANLASSSSPSHTVNVYPRYSRLEARQIWRASSLAKAVAPSLNLSLGTEEEEDEMGALESIRLRIDEARAARSRLRSGFSDSPGFKPTSIAQTYQQPFSVQPTSSTYQVHQGSSIPAPNPFQYQLGSPINTSHLPTYNPTQSPKKPLARSTPQTGSASLHHSGLPFQQRNTQGTIFPHQHSSSQSRNDQQYQSASYQSNYPSYPSVMEESANTIPHLDEFGSSNHPPNRFEEETEALAYALGLTTYSTSPRRSNFKTPSVAAATPQASSSSSAWLDQSGGSYDLASIDQQLQGSAQDDNEAQQNIAIDFFSDYDLDMPSNNPQLSVLHQLGLQGGFGMSSSMGDHERIESNGQVESAQAVASSINTTDNHQNPVQWLQPIRGI